VFELLAGSKQETRRQAAMTTAEAPSLKSLMTSTDEATIQDSAPDYWQLTKGDLFLLADASGKVIAFLSSDSGIDRNPTQGALTETLENGAPRDWWFLAGRLYDIYVQPITSGSQENGVVRGVLATGFAVDDSFASDLAGSIGSDIEIAFRYGDAVAASSLNAYQQQELSMWKTPPGEGAPRPEEIVLGGETYVAETVPLFPERVPPVTLTVMKSYDAATQFLQGINQLLIGVGLIVLMAGAGLMFLIAHTLTRPITKLVSGVSALEKGDYSYPLSARSHDEVGELVHAFDTMRKSLQENQQRLLHAERLATIGRMAGTITHDLRHPLTTILAYAELLSEGKLDEEQRRDMYEQIRMSVNNMAELIASLLEFSKAQEALNFAYGDCLETLQDTVRTVKLRPAYSRIQLSLLHEGTTQGWFDFAKLGRVFHNLLRNACEAVSPDSGRIRIVARGANNRVEISVSDNGSGIPEEIRDEVFQPFITSGKRDGTGLGLAVVEKIVRDHGGEVVVESTGSRGTTFKVTLPVMPPVKTAPIQ
jgi:signal transduction histidine kinase